MTAAQMAYMLDNIAFRLDSCIMALTRPPLQHTQQCACPIRLLRQNLKQAAIQAQSLKKEYRAAAPAGPINYQD